MLGPRVFPYIVRVEGAPRACDLGVRRVPPVPPVPGSRSVCLAASPGFGLVGFLACATSLPVSDCLVTPPAAIVDVQLYSRGMTRETGTGNDLGEAG